MSKLSEKIAYLRGLAEGLGVSSDKPENKVLAEVIEALDLASKKLDYVEESIEDLNDYVDEIDNDLTELEDIFTDEDYNDECGCDCDCNCDDDDEDDVDLVYECPHCGAELELDVEDVQMEEDTKCPECGKSVFIDDEDEEQ